MAFQRPTISAPKDTETLLGDGSGAGTPGANLVPLRIMRKPVAVHSPLQDEAPRLSPHFKRKATGEDGDQYAPLGENPELNPPRSSSGWRDALRVWSWEVAAVIVSGMAFTAIIIMLRQFEDASLEYWKAPISINAVVAILSAIFRGLLFIPISNGLGQLKWLLLSQSSQRLVDTNIYDQASRGVWGSIVLLVRQFTHHHASFAAFLGSFLGIIALITEPFSQAAVFIDLCERSLPQQAALPRANGYDNAGHVGAGTSELSSKMQFAVLNGFYNPPKNSSQSINSLVTCPTGNCTFSDSDGSTYFDTLDMCSSCTDISSKIKTTTEIRDGPREYYLSGYPSNITLYISDTPDFRGQVFGFMSTAGVPQGNLTEPWPDGPWKSTSFFSFQGMATVLRNGHTRPAAFDCSLRACVRSLSARVVKGRYTEEEHGRQYLHYIASAWQLEAVLNRTRINGTWHTCTGSETKTATNNVQVVPPELQQTGTLTNSTNTGHWYEAKCYYMVNRGVGFGFSGYLKPMFDKARVSRDQSLTGDVWAKELWNQGNMTMASVNKFAAGLAASIGAEIRRDGSTVLLGKDALMVHGDMTRIEPCIKVVWAYLSFLAYLWILTAFFCTVIIVAQHRSRLGAGNDWKTSILPLLFQAISNGDGLSSTAPYRESDLHRRAQDVMVELRDSRGRWVIQPESDPDHALQSISS